MVSLADLITVWQAQILAALALMVAAIGLISCLRIRHMAIHLARAKEQLVVTTQSLEQCQHDSASVQQDLNQSELNNQLLRQQSIECKVRIEERERQFAQQSDDLRRQRQEIKELNERHALAMAELAEIRMAIDKERSHHQEKFDLLDQSRDKLKQELQLLANNILQSNSSKLAADNETQVRQLLNPVREQLHSFQKKVEDVYEKEAQQRFSLTAEIGKLQSLNARISEDAIALTNALKGENKIAGNWGEMVLERILESSGLCKGREFFVQTSFNSSNNGKAVRLQPDMIVKLPQDRSVVIDAKVSLAAYERMHNSRLSTEKTKAARELSHSIRQHVKGLSRKKYHQIDALISLDLVLLFIPVEGAYFEAVSQEPGLLNEALQKNIVIVSPSTLVTTLRVIQGLWQQQYQNQNAIEIARLAGGLYDKFASFGEDLLVIGQRLEQSQNAYQQAMERLNSGRGNLLARVEKLKVLGARTSKHISAGLRMPHLASDLEKEGDQHTNAQIE